MKHSMQRRWLIGILTAAMVLLTTVCPSVPVMAEEAAEAGWIAGSEAVAHLNMDDSVPTGNRTSSDAPDGSIGTAVCVARTSMNLRSGPGTSYKKIGTLPGSASVKVYRQSGNWYQIWYDSRYCWVSGAYLSVTMDPVPGPSAEPYPTPAPTSMPDSPDTDGSIGTAKCIARNSMNLRKGPGTDYGKAGTLPGGTVVPVLEKKGNWYKIRYDGLVCWASGDYLSVALNPVPSLTPSFTPVPEPTPVPPVQDPEDSIGTAKCLAIHYMNLRKGPGTGYEKAGTLPGGTVVSVYEQNGNWYRIVFNGKSCWACGDYLSVTMNEPDPVDDNLDVDRYVLLLRDMGAAAADPSSETIGKLDEDVAAMEDACAYSIAEHWKNVYLNEAYHLLIFGKDDIKEIPVRGRHAFVVLGYELKDGEMTEELKGRCDAAAAAARAFPESLIICTGGATGQNNPELHTEAGEMKKYLTEACGIAPARIVTEEESTTTYANAFNVLTILEERKIETITVITSSYHQKRAQVLFNGAAAVWRRDKGYSVEIVGNCNYNAEGKTDPPYKIAIRQLAAILGIPDDQSAGM